MMICILCVDLAPRSSWLSTCSSNAWISMRHPSWHVRTLQSFGAELAHQTTDWRQLFLRLARACHSVKEMSFDEREMSSLFIRQEEEEEENSEDNCEDTSIIRRNFDLGNPSWDLELQLGTGLCRVEFHGPFSF